MALKKCSGCNVMMDASENKEYCSNCSAELFHQYSEDKQEEIYYKVREYLLEHPKTPKTTVADIMNISIKVIDKWIREGKIEEIDGMMTSGELAKKYSVCSKCGKKIDSGMLCDHCRKEFSPSSSEEAAPVGFRSSVVSK
jgi:predicted amidophosphoribosyltransferase